MIKLLKTKQISVLYLIIPINQNNNHKKFTKITVPFKIILNNKKIRDIMFKNIKKK